MTLGKRIGLGGAAVAALTLATAAAGTPAWRWPIAAVAVLCGAGLSVWLIRLVSTTLRRSVGELYRSAEEVASAAGQVAASSQSLAQGASEQAASLEETSASSEELSSMTQSNADNARSAAELMLEAERLVGSANTTLAEMVTSMSEINEASDKIARIIKVIDEIAFQTNILALNAAVEAARAGEAGMGFAVVADEVRNLAQRSAQAAKDTAAIIEESIAKSAEGSKNLDDVKAAVSAITESASKVKTLVDEVSVGSQEQAQGFAEITNAITQMQQVTQRAAASSEESASASEQLTSQAESMRTTVHSLSRLAGEEAAGVTGRRRPSRRIREPRRQTEMEPALEDAGESFPMDGDFR